MSRQAAYLRLGYAVALAAALTSVALILIAADGARTLGFDYRAYDHAADRLLAGQPLYDPNAQSTGSFDLYFYPPPFALLLIPLSVLPEDLATWIWTALSVVGVGAAVWLLPVSERVRWVVLLLAALSWPLVYALKLGQVGPLVLLLFALGWRWLDRPGPFGVAAAVGTMIKIQPALLIGWAYLTGRLRAAAIALVTLAVLALVATLVAGRQVWLDELSLLARVSQPVLTEHAFGPGRLAYEAGAPEGVATLIHYANLALVVAATLWVIRRGSTAASYLAAVVASQFLSPVLWDHYALVLLLPVAWLLERGRWWAAAIPLATSTPLLFLGVDLPIVYPAVFWATLLAIAWEGRVAGRPQERLRAQGTASAGGILGS